MESILPSPGTTSPRFTFKMPLGPSRAAIPFVTSRTVHPSIVVGLVSGTGVRLVPLSVSFPLTRIELVFRCEPDECPIIDEPAEADAPCDSFGRLLVDEERCSEPASALASTKASRTPLPSGSIGSRFVPTFHGVNAYPLARARRSGAVTLWEKVNSLTPGIGDMLLVQIAEARQIGMADFLDLHANRVL